MFLLGRVLQFQSLSNTNPNPIFEYTIERGKDSGEGTKASQKKGRPKISVEDNIGVNCTWYQFDQQGPKSKKISTTGRQLNVVVHGFHPCSTYVCSLPPPETPEFQIIRFCDEIVKEVTAILSKIK